jgi:preprotein translocase subunit YajC
MEFTAMVFLLAVLVVAMLGGFFFAWKRDKDRSETVADDSARLDTDTSLPTTHGVDGH